ncbi:MULTISPECIES: hypothetical protein [Enterobacter cloacae complex]|uniref:hypothetical protein n=1 Tax=Enterobacter cloacae complex TaxID=354276 RepID=UPI00064AAA71|nr:hypothetical protein [Enterobacter hormaechei]KLQ80103.1 hypothetical protein ABF63_09195 [Enterobacter hormaechei subsp. steigerwaltii]
MINQVKFSELENRVDLLVNRVLELEQQVRTLRESQGGDIPPGMISVATLAAEFGISTKKAEELAKNTGVMLVRMKAGGFIAPDSKFREVARQVLRSAKRKYGSAYWYHPLLGKFQMSGGIPQ